MIFLTGEKRPDSTIEAIEAGHEEIWEEQFEGSHHEAFEAKKKPKDFVKRNIEVWQKVTQGQMHLWGILHDLE